MASSTALFSFKLSLFNSLHHQRVKNSKASFSNSHINPRIISSSTNNHLSPTRVTYPLLTSHSSHKRRFQVQAQEYSAGNNSESVASDQEKFSWSSVILPFVFPALGGLLFGYDIGATSGATISLQSPELSGVAWSNLSSVQLGLVGGSGNLLVQPCCMYLVVQSLPQHQNLVFS